MRPELVVIGCELDTCASQVLDRTPSPLVGVWHLDATHSASGAFIDPKGASITDLYVAAANRAYTRSTDGQLWLTGVDLDTKSTRSASVAISSAPNQLRLATLRS